MPQFATFWAGRLDALERACLASFHRQGHEVVLYSYEDRIPSLFYDIRPASEILDESYLSQFRTGGRPNVAAFSDAFRIMMFTKTPYIWMDCDLFLKGIFSVTNDDDIFIREGEKNIIAALLRISDKQIADRALKMVLSLAGRDLPWAATQNMIPRAMKAEGYKGKISKASTYNPVPADEFYKLLLPEYREECAELCSRAETVHLYNNILQKVGFFKDLLPPEGSYLAELVSPYVEEAGFIGTYPADTVRAMVEGWSLRFSGRSLGLGAVLRRVGPAAITTLRRKQWA